MVQKIVVDLVDDVDGSAATRTVSFGWEGRQYDIDLSDKNYAQLAKAVGKFVEHARQTKHGKVQNRIPVGVDNRAVRAWAAAHGIPVSDRGRVAQDVIEQYRAAGN
jgi:hypothetical protein